MSLHTATFKGRRVRIKLKDGTIIIDKFLDRTDKWVMLVQRGRIRRGDIKSFSDFKQREVER